MNLIHEYSLLIAIALPVLAIVVLNLFLALTGERHTLLLPVPMSFAPVTSEVRVMRKESARAIDTAADSANDERELQAA